MSLGVIMLRNSLKISDTTKTKFFELTFFQSNQKNEFSFKECFCVFTMLNAHKGSDKGLFRHLSNSAFWSLQFQKSVTSEAPLFFKVFKILCTFRKSIKKFSKYFSISRQLHLNLCVKHLLLLRENTFHGVSIC